jgi:hypothetical protein
VKNQSYVRSRLSLCATAALLTFLLAAGAPRSAMAQASDAAERCTADVMRLCSEFVPDAARIVVCLKSKRRQLTHSCSTALQPQGGKHKRRARRPHG